MKTVLATIVALTLFSLSANAGPWTPAPGTAYVKVWTKWLPGVGYHSGDGTRKDYGAYHELFLDAYAEVGITSKLGAWAYLPLVHNFFLTDPRTGKSTSHLHPGDPTLGLRMQFLRVGRFAMAAEASVKPPIAPAGPVQDVIGTDAANTKVGELRVGTGVWDLSGGVTAGASTGRLSVSGAVGYMFRTGGFDDVLAWNLGSGWRVRDWWMTRSRFTGWHSLKTGSAPRTESPSGIGNGTSYIGLALENDFRMSRRWSLGFTLEGGLFARRQTGGLVLSLGLSTML